MFDGFQNKNFIPKSHHTVFVTGEFGCKDQGSEKALAPLRPAIISQSSTGRYEFRSKLSLNAEQYWILFGSFQLRCLPEIMGRRLSTSQTKGALDSVARKSMTGPILPSRTSSRGVGGWLASCLMRRLEPRRAEPFASRSIDQRHTSLSLSE
jgi:hypothetical protein